MNKHNKLIEEGFNVSRKVTHKKPTIEDKINLSMAMVSTLLLLCTLMPRGLRLKFTSEIL